MTRILAIDPGTTTGLAVYHTTEDRWELAQIGPEPHHLALYRLCCNADEIVCEDFNFRPNPGRRKIVLDSKEYIGIAKLASEQYDIPLRMQLPSQAKGLWSDDKLKALDRWFAGNSYKHAMDATRHMLYYLTVWKKDNTFVMRLKGKL